jgi:hypothetical protein
VSAPTLAGGDAPLFASECALDLRWVAPARLPGRLCVFSLRLLLLLCFALFTGLLTGCTANSQAPSHISGTVSYKGSPVPGGTITFHSDGEGIYSYALSADGKFAVRNIPKGALLVTVETESVNPKKKVKDYGGKGDKQYQERIAAEGNSAANKTPPPAYVHIPSKYANAKTSGLTITAAAGDQVHDFNLTD